MVNQASVCVNRKLREKNTIAKGEERKEGKLRQ
jgi:hypothetical protein